LKIGISAVYQNEFFDFPLLKFPDNCGIELNVNDFIHAINWNDADQTIGPESELYLYLCIRDIILNLYNQHNIS